MGRQIIKQPNGKYAVFSSIVDDFIFINITIEEYIKFRIAEESEQIRETIQKIATQLDKSEKPYHVSTMSWDEALDTISELHGLIRVSKIFEEIEK